MAPNGSIIIPVCNQWALSQRCLEILFHHIDSQRVEVIVRNNGSADEAAQGLSHVKAPLGVRERLTQAP